jgi:hypothetical protein
MLGWAKRQVNKDGQLAGQVLINAVTGKVGPSTQLTDNPTYQDLTAWLSSRFIEELVGSNHTPQK